jgi:hypothetical protein
MANISVHAHQGRKLPTDWKAQAPVKARAAEANYLARMEAAWRGPLKGSREGVTARDVRLTQDSAPHRADSGPNGSVRLDGEMKMVGRQDDGWELWRDSATGATVWRRLK